MTADDDDAELSWADVAAANVVTVIVPVWVVDVTLEDDTKNPPFRCGCCCCCCGQDRRATSTPTKAWTDDDVSVVVSSPTTNKRSATSRMTGGHLEFLFVMVVDCTSTMMSELLTDDVAVVCLLSSSRCTKQQPKAVKGAGIRIAWINQAS